MSEFSDNLPLLPPFAGRAGEGPLFSVIRTCGVRTTGAAALLASCNGLLNLLNLNCSHSVFCCVLMIKVYDSRVPPFE